VDDLPFHVTSAQLLAVFKQRHSPRLSSFFVPTRISWYDLFAIIITVIVVLLFPVDLAIINIINDDDDDDDDDDGGGDDNDDGDGDDDDDDDVAYSVIGGWCRDCGVGSSWSSMCGRQCQCCPRRRRSRQLGPDISQLAVEAVLVRRSTGPGRQRPAPVKTESRAGRRGGWWRDNSTVGAQVGGRTGTCWSQQAGVGDMHDVAMRYWVTLNLTSRVIKLPDVIFNCTMTNINVDTETSKQQLC